MTTIQSNTRRTFVWLLSVSLLLPLRAFADGSDNFNDNSKDTTKWGADVVTGGFGILSEQNQRLEFTVNNVLTDGDTQRPWTIERFPVNADWAVQVDTFNSTTPSMFGQVNSGGFTLFHPTTAASEIYVELYAVQFGKGFVGNLVTADVDVGSADTTTIFGNEAAMGAVRMEYNSATKVATCFYDVDTSDGYQWIQLASYGLAGAGGTTTNTDWGLSTNQQFSVWVYGFSEFMTVSSGQLYLDNFTETGGVTPIGGPSPVPVGSFRFRFPTNNLLLTAIAYLAGNYTGSSPRFSENTVPRTYNLDVAQDESGKLTAMGTVDGITNSQGNNELSGSVGAVVTLNDKPTLQVNTSFTGTADGVPATSKTTGSGVVEITDIGGGSNALALTLDISAKAAGVPFSLKDTPVLFPSSSLEANIKKSWTLDLDISRKVVNGKEVTVGSAQLLLPNGDTISFPERTVKYSTSNGYKLSFKKGTNVTVIPNRIDKKTSIKIQGLTFVQQGADWQPTGGTINYRFLGQQGTASLLEFVAP